MVNDLVFGKHTGRLLRPPSRNNGRKSYDAHAGGGRQVQSGGQRTVRVSVLCEKGDLIVQAIMAISQYGDPRRPEPIMTERSRLTVRSEGFSSTSLQSLHGVPFSASACP